MNLPVNSGTKSDLENIRELLEASAPTIGRILQETFGEKGSPPVLEFVDKQHSAGETTALMSYDPDRDVIDVRISTVVSYLSKKNPREAFATLGHELGHCYHYRKNHQYLLELPKGRENAKIYARKYGLMTLYEVRAYGESLAYFAEDNIRKEFALRSSIEFFKDDQILWLHSSSSRPDYGTLLTAVENLLGFVFSTMLQAKEKRFIDQYMRLSSFDALKGLDPAYLSLSPEKKVRFLSNWIERLTGLSVDFEPLFESLRWKL